MKEIIEQISKMMPKEDLFLCVHLANLKDHQNTKMRCLEDLKNIYVVLDELLIYGIVDPKTRKVRDGIPAQKTAEYMTGIQCARSIFDSMLMSDSEIFDPEEATSILPPLPEGQSPLTEIFDLDNPEDRRLWYRIIKCRVFSVEVLFHSLRKKDGRLRKYFAAATIHDLLRRCSLNHKRKLNAPIIAALNNQMPQSEIFCCTPLRELDQHPDPHIRRLCYLSMQFHVVDDLLRRYTIIVDPVKRVKREDCVFDIPDTQVQNIIYLKHYVLTMKENDRVFDSTGVRDITYPWNKVPHKDTLADIFDLTNSEQRKYWYRLIRAGVHNAGYLRAICAENDNEWWEKNHFDVYTKKFITNLAFANNPKRKKR